MAKKISELTNDDIRAFIRVDDTSAQATIELEVIKAAALNYIRQTTGLYPSDTTPPVDPLETKEMFTIAYLCLIGSMWENRQSEIYGYNMSGKSNSNQTVDCILNCERINLL